jgi:FkbM family methyltransferase
MIYDSLYYSLFQLLPNFKGKLRFSRVFYTNPTNLKKSRKIKVKYGLIFHLPSLIDSIGYELFINGIYEKKLINYLIKNIPPNGVFVDVGANIGSISLFVARRRPDIRVYAFEASPYIYKFLKSNKEINKLHNVELYNYAIHNTDNSQLLFYAPEDEFGKGSFKQTYTNKEEYVSTITLDSFLSNNEICPDIIKVDVQGFELNVFQGLNSFITHSPKKPDIIFEFEDWAEEIALGKENISIAQKYLHNLGYSIYEFDKPNMPKIKDLIDAGSRELIAKFE